MVFLWQENCVFFIAVMADGIEVLVACRAYGVFMAVMADGVFLRQLWQMASKFRLMALEAASSLLELSC